jgi:hypothetical protein
MRAWGSRLGFGHGGVRFILDKNYVQNDEERELGTEQNEYLSGRKAGQNLMGHSAIEGEREGRAKLNGS